MGSGFNLIVHQSLLMVPRFNHRSFRPNSGNNSSSLCTRTKPLTNHRRPVEDLQVRFRMLLANCLVPSILLIQRVNIRFLEASIDTRSTQRPSRSSQTILVFQFLSLSLITVLLTKDLHTMALLTCLIMVLLRRSRNMVTAWATTWFEQLPAILPCISPHASPSYDATKCSSRSSPGNASRDSRYASGPATRGACVPERATRNPPSPVWESSYSSSKAQDWALRRLM